VTPQFGAFLTTLAKAKAKTNENIYGTGVTIVTYDRKNMFIVQAIGLDAYLSRLITFKLSSIFLSILLIFNPQTD